MMPARSTQFFADNFYHVFNRGSEKRTIFSTDKDYRNFIERAKQNAQKCSIDIVCYCLMPNHFHFLLKQNTAVSISQFMNPLQLGYAKFFNTKYARVGPLFQGRFKAKLVESDEYLLHLSAYIHRNPIARLFDSGYTKDSRNFTHSKLLSYPYSSYGQYCNLKAHGFAIPAYVLDYFSKDKPNFSYESFVERFEMNDDVIASTFLYEG